MIYSRLRLYSRPRHLLIAAAAAWICAGAQATPVAAWQPSSVLGFTNSSWSFGDVFTVGAQSITVTSLGAIDIGRNGFVTVGGVQVGLFLESNGSLLASTTVKSTDTLAGDYRFADIANKVLAANTTYRVVAVSGSDQYNIGTGVNTDSRITWNSYAYCNTTSLTFCNRFTGTDQTWFANFQLADTVTSSVPEPGSLTLVGLAALCAVAASRRRRLG